MTPYNDSYILGLDLGYGNIKTSRICFPTGLTKHDSEPAFNGKILKYGDTYYKVGENRKTVTVDKTADNDFRILAYAGIAAECLAYNLNEVKVILAVGVPTSLVKSQREETRAYLMKNPVLDLEYNGHNLKIELERCFVFPQGYPALFDRNSEMTGVNIIADIGNGTMNIIHVFNKKVVESKCHTETIGVQQFRTDAANRVLDKFGKNIDPEIIEMFICGKPANLSEKYVSLLEDTARDYCKMIYDTLTRYGYDRDFAKLYVVGGGGALIKRYADYDKDRVIFTDDVCASAKGFEHYALLKLKAEKGRWNNGN